jgi:putative Ca2+/H+ antiporter (TMEM165/GDT1 family)
MAVLLGITAATAVVHAASVAIGHGPGEALPTGWIGLAAGLAFLGFGARAIRGHTLTEQERPVRNAPNRDAGVP